MKKPSRSDSSLMTPEARRTSCFEPKKVTVYLFTDTYENGLTIYNVLNLLLETSAWTLSM